LNGVGVLLLHRFLTELVLIFFNIQKHPLS
jgi:hypothetical protein